jgi:hypothetical protein
MALTSLRDSETVKEKRLNGFSNKMSKWFMIYIYQSLPLMSTTPTQDFQGSRIGVFGGFGSFLES